MTGSCTSGRLRAQVIASGVIAAACSFYTDCPTCGNQQPAGTAAKAAGGTAGMNGTSGTGGTTGSAGTGGLAVDAGGGGAAGGEDTVEVVPGAWDNITGVLGGRNIACGGLTYLSAKPDEDLLIAGLSEAGLWATRDGGNTWTSLGSDSHSAPIANRPSAIVYDPDDSNRFWEAGIYVRGGVYRTDDDGVTFQQLGDVWHNEYLSIDFSDSKRRTMLAGGHEQQQMLFQSTDAGNTWEALGDKVPTSCNWSTFPVFIDANTYLLGCINGILRTTDAGETWDTVSSLGGASPPLFASDGTIYWADQNGGLVSSTDAGETWTRVVGGGVLQTRPVELPDGRLAAVVAQSVAVSKDGGTRWEPVTMQLPYAPTGLVYSVERRAFFVWRSTCDPLVPPDAVLRSAFDFEQR